MKRREGNRCENEDKRNEFGKEKTRKKIQQ